MIGQPLKRDRSAEERVPVRRNGIVVTMPPYARKQALIAGFLVIAAVLMAWPFYGTVFGDDFSYMRTALDYARSSKLVYNGWSSALLGWQIPYGALFIRAFGFSFNVLRVAMLPIAFGCIYVFHGILVRFGIGRRDALLGALTLGFTPLFLPLAFSFMSDLPGLLAVLICIALCQCAAAAETEEATLAWLVAAAASNDVLGSVRQISWLGVLVMVPATAWFLRRRRRVLLGTGLAWLMSLAAIAACLHWFGQQPYTAQRFVPAKVNGVVLWWVVAEAVRAFFCLALVIAPICVAFVIPRRGDRGAIYRYCAVLGIATALYAWWATHYGVFDMVMPWLQSALASQGLGHANSPTPPPVTLPWKVCVAVSLGVIVSAYAASEYVILFWTGRGRRTGGDGGAMFWILGPFTVCACALILDTAFGLQIQDRYLLLLAPTAILVLMRIFEESISPHLTNVSWALLVVFGLYSIAALRTFGAAARATDDALARLRAAGVPRNEITLGLGPDEWYEIERRGHVNYRLMVPPSEYVADFSGWHIPIECREYGWELTPSLHPQYMVTGGTGRCFGASGFTPVPYTSWLPPFHRKMQIQRLVTTP